MGSSSSEEEEESDENDYDNSSRVATRRLRFKIYAFACRGVYMTTERAVMGGKKVTFLSFSRDKFTPV